MEKFRLGNTGTEVSALCLGAMYFGSKNDEPTSTALLDEYVEAGGSFIDTANAYARWIEGCRGGESEALIGRWMRERRNRSGLFLATKVGFPAPVDDLEFGASRSQIARACECSLRRLGTDVIDLYYVHADDRAAPLAERLEAFDRLRAAGKIRFAGASNITDWRLEEARWTAREGGWMDYCCVQQRYSYVRPQAGSLYDPHVVVDDAFLDYAGGRELAIMAYSPLLGGAYDRSDRGFPPQYEGPDTELRLSVLSEVARECGATRNQLVLAWMLRSDPPVIPIIAASRREHLAELLASVKLRPTTEQLARLSDAGNRPSAHPNAQRKHAVGAKRG